MRHIDREFPGEKILHVVMDNYGTHGHAVVKPGFVSILACHSLCSYQCSWLNLIERWFANSPTSASGADQSSASRKTNRRDQ